MERRGILGHAILEEVMFASPKEPALRRFEGRHELVGLGDGYEKGVTKDGPRKPAKLVENGNRYVLLWIA
jgi:hypothetical protein